MSATVPLASRSFTHPLDPSDEIPHKDIFSLKKFQANACLGEIKTLLGREINTRYLMISLPENKYIKRTRSIISLLLSTRVSLTQLKSFIGRLNHVTNIISILRHFIGRLCHALLRCSRRKWATLQICEKSDLHLCLSFLDEAKKGISMNNQFRKPTLILRSDASKFGIGGYNITSGKAWRFELPVDCRL